MRVKITLACTETGDRNYITTKNKRTHPDRLELKKYSPRLKRHTLHRETKIEKIYVTRIKHFIVCAPLFDKGAYFLESL
jgi:large subunit ribosomal protein L33